MKPSVDLMREIYKEDGPWRITLWSPDKEDDGPSESGHVVKGETFEEALNAALDHIGPVK